MNDGNNMIKNCRCHGPHGQGMLIMAVAALIILCMASCSVFALPPARRAMDVPRGTEPRWDFPPTTVREGTGTVQKVWRDMLVTPANSFGAWTTECRQLAVSGWARRRSEAEVSPVATWGRWDETHVYAPLFEAAQDAWTHYLFILRADDAEEVGKNIEPYSVTNIEMVISLELVSEEREDEEGAVVEEPVLHVYTNWVEHVEWFATVTTVWRAAQSFAGWCWDAAGNMQEGGVEYGTDAQPIKTVFSGGFLNINWDGGATGGAETSAVMEFWAWQVLGVGENNELYTLEEMAVRREEGFRVIEESREAWDWADAAGEMKIIF